MPVPDGLIAIALLGLIAGGGIIVVDYLVLRRIRSQPVKGHASNDEPADDTNDRSD